MRYAGFIAALLLVPTCGPDPNAQLPGIPSVNTGGSGGSVHGSGGAIGSGGTTTAKGGSGGTTGSSGGIVGTGGKVGTGGAPGSGGVVGTGGRPPSSGGVVGTGGGNGTGGGVGAGGTTTIGQGGRGGIDAPGAGGTSGIDGGGGAEPCTPSQTITGTGSGNTGNFGTTGEFCFRTPDTISGWNCSNFDGRTLQVNGVTKTCGALPLPAKVNGYYYFDASPGTYSYASIYWY